MNSCILMNSCINLSQTPLFAWNSATKISPKPPGNTLSDATFSFEARLPPVCCCVLQWVALCCTMLQCVALSCSVLQCVTVCCSVYQASHIIAEKSRLTLQKKARFAQFLFDKLMKWLPNQLEARHSEELFSSLFSMVNFEYDYLFSTLTNPLVNCFQWWLVVSQIQHRYLELFESKPNKTFTNSHTYRLLMD
jgi:hypothetical protein